MKNNDACGKYCEIVTDVKTRLRGG